MRTHQQVLTILKKMGVEKEISIRQISKSMNGKGSLGKAGRLIGAGKFLLAAKEFKDGNST